MKRILVAVDFSDTTELVVDAAYRLAKALKEGIHLVHLVEVEPTFAAYGFTPDAFPAAYELTQESMRRSDEKLRKIAQDLGAVDVKTKVLEGSRFDCLMEYAAEIDADLLVLGSHGHGYLHTLLLGSLAESCLRKGEIPTLIIPSKKKG